MKKTAFSFILTMALNASAAFQIECKLFEDNPKPVGLKEIVTFAPSSLELQQKSASWSEATAEIQIPVSQGFDAKVEFTEIEKDSGVVWEGKIRTTVGSVKKHSSTCFYKGIGYHLFEDSRGQYRALHCRILTTLDLRQPLDKKRSELLLGNPAEVCVRGGTSSTSGSWFR